jgi:hypothetical protein
MSFHLIWCWVWLVSLWECLVFHLLWCEVTKVRIDAMVWAWVQMVEMVGFCQMMWFVMLEPAKDWIMGVDTLGQHVPPRVWYGTAWWLISKALVSLSCWMSGTDMAIPTRPQGAREPKGILLYPIWGNICNCKRGQRVFCCIQQGETYGKARYTI